MCTFQLIELAAKEEAAYQSLAIEELDIIDICGEHLEIIMPEESAFAKVGAKGWHKWAYAKDPHLSRKPPDKRPWSWSSSPDRAVDRGGG